MDKRTTDTLLRPVAPVPDQAVKEAEKQATSNAPGFLEAVKLSASQDWTLPWLLQDLGLPDDFVDPNWTLDEETLKKLTEGLPEDYWPMFEEARSLKHAELIRERALAALEAERKLASLGLKGIGLRVLMSMLDPLTLAASLVTEGAVGGISAVSKGTKAAQILKSGIAGAAGAASAEAIVAYAKPNGNPADVAIGALAGFGLGSLSRALRLGTSAASAVAKAARAPKQQRLSPSAFLKAVQKQAAKGGRGGRGGAGAPTPGTPPNLTSDPVIRNAQELLDKWAQEAPFSAFGSVRFSAVGRAKTSPHPGVRALAAKLGEDAIGNADDSVNEFAATEFQAWLSRRYDVQFYRSVLPHFDEWAQRNGLGPIQRLTRRSEFMSEVTKALRNPSAPVSAEARAAADKVRQIFRDYAETLANPGRFEGRQATPVAGAEALAPNDTYVPRIYSYTAFESAIRKHGVQAVEALFERAIKNAVQGIEDDVARRVARHMVRVIREAAYTSDLDRMRIISGEDLGEFKRLLKQSGTLTDKELDRLFDLLESRKPSSEKAASPRLRRRQLLDETTTITTKAGTLRFEDLLENNLERIWAAYNRGMSGLAALARLGYRSIGEFETELERIAKTANIEGYTRDRLEADLRSLEWLATAVTGRPVGKFGKQLFESRRSRAGIFAQMLRDYNFIRVGGQLGWAQLPELFNAAGHLGVRTMLQYIPSFRWLVRSARKGQLDDELLKEIEAVWGIGADDLKGAVLERFDEVGTFIDPEEGSVLNKARDVLAVGKRAAAVLSGMVPVNRMLYRWTYKAVIGKFANAALNDAKVWNPRRLAAYGLSEADVDAIKAQIRAHTTKETGITVAKIKRLNLDQWDPDVRFRFIMAVQRIARRIIQENDPGNIPPFMSRPLWQLVFQFRTFATVAWEKQLLAGIRMRDRAAFVSFVGSMFGGSLTYIAQTYVQSIGREDRERWLRRRLDPAEIAKAGIQRAGWSSLLPIVVETPWNLVSDEPLFAYRTTQLPSNAIFGNPTFDLLDKIHLALRLPRRAAKGDLTQEDLRNFYGIFPFQNLIGIQNALLATMKGLPRNDRDK